MSTTSVPELYGSLVFNDKVMRERLPKDIYKAVHKTIQNGSHLELDVANTVAATMKEWALELGATHFTHWFQPMTGLTAEKHEGRAGCLLLPERRPPRHLRGPRLYRMGPELPSLHQGRHPLHPDRILLVLRRVPR